MCLLALQVLLKQPEDPYIHLTAAGFLKAWSSTGYNMTSEVGLAHSISRCASRIVS
jgi:hypothetical protein